MLRRSQNWKWKPFSPILTYNVKALGLDVTSIKSKNELVREVMRAMK